MTLLSLASDIVERRWVLTRHMTEKDCSLVAVVIRIVK